MEGGKKQRRDGSILKRQPLQVDGIGPVSGGLPREGEALKLSGRFLTPLSNKGNLSFLPLLSQTGSLTPSLPAHLTRIL